MFLSIGISDSYFVLCNSNIEFWIQLISFIQIRNIAKDVEEGQYEHYNILPLHAVRVKPAIMELPEVIYDDSAASSLLHSWFLLIHGVCLSSLRYS